MVIYQRSPTYIKCSDITYVLPSGRKLFTQLNCVLSGGIYGLVGQNGLGKTTLLKLMAGLIRPDQGSVLTKGNMAFLEQNSVYSSTASVAAVLGIEEKLRTLELIGQGQYTSARLDSLNTEDWTLRERLAEVLAWVGLSVQELTRVWQTLSGGERMRVELARLRLLDPDIILLDEPTNNLDIVGRQLVYNYLQSMHKKIVVVVSHDRELLGYAETILELANMGLSVYGGNYATYRQQKTKEQQALLQQVNTAEQHLKKEKAERQQQQERQLKRMRTGAKQVLKGGTPRILAGLQKRRAEKTMARGSTVAQERYQEAVQKVISLKDKLQERNIILIDIPGTEVPRQKELLLAEQFNLRFERAADRLYAKPLNFSVYGPERLAIEGVNGAGKSTLLQVIYALAKQQDLSFSCSGSLLVRTDRIVYLDQQVALLEDTVSLLENYTRYTPHLTEAERRIRLGRFLFTQERALQLAGTLSGGERIRAGLACILYGEYPPHMLMLDEPTNNLDLDSIEQLESALACFRGALLVVSHDSHFLAALGVHRVLAVEKNMK